MLTPLKFQRGLLKWFDQNGRKNLPWQQQISPYRVWISEIMLQQTQVVTVIPYFEKFIAAFPNITSLATASLDEVLHLWTGLGYYSRARNLHRAANIICEQYAGVFPNTLDDLVSLPGIGESTAGAILAIAFGKKATILDGNVKRVLTRLFAITEWSGDKKTLGQLWQIATDFTPTKRIADYTQAIMDMGATLCLRAQPLCPHCPFLKNCQAYQLDITKKIPVARQKKPLPIRRSTFLIIEYQGRILLRKRAGSGVWQGLWCPPEVNGSFSKQKILTLCQQEFRFHVNEFTLGTTFRHTFSHFHLDITPVFIQLKQTPTKIMDNDQQLWYNLQQSQQVGLPAPVKKLLRSLAI